MKKMVFLAAAFAAMAASAASSCEATDLLHRWSFNGSLEDACGGNTAVVDAGAQWNDAEHPTGITLPGGSHGAGSIELGYDCGTPGNELTLEIWAQQNAVNYWSRVFDWGPGDTSNYLLMSWSQNSTLASDCVEFKVAGANPFRPLDTMQPYTLGTQFHISMRVTQRANGGLDAKWQKRDAVTGAVLAEGSAGTDTKWSLAKFNEWRLLLGRS